MKTAVIYASKTGTVKKMAGYIAEKISADLYNVKEGVTDIGQYERVVLGSGVYAGKLSKHMVKFIESNDLASKKVELFVCCRFTGEKAEEQLNKITSKFPVVSSATFFGGKEREPSDADAYIGKLSE